MMVEMNELLWRYRKFLVKTLRCIDEMDPDRYDLIYALTKFEREAELARIEHPLTGKLDKMTIEEVLALSDKEYIELNEPMSTTWGRGTFMPDKILMMRILIEWLGDSARRVADIGCGLSLNLTFLASLGWVFDRLVGVDALSGMLERGRNIAESLGIEYELIRTYANDQSLSEGEFDHVFSFDAIHWCHEWKADVRNMARMTAENGELLLIWVSIHERKTIPYLEVVAELSSCGIDVVEARELGDDEVSLPRSLVKGVKRPPQSIILSF